MDKQQDFFYRLAEKDMDEGETYRCVYDKCTIFWHPRRGVTGSAGVAGCDCERLKDPRDLMKGPV